ncbi:tripartite tricarboxylate transporter permease [Nitratireductor kimnyeongensis]|uniref:Tripartite tricarboxylate transporter permease n=1 Tax=Nitratireductor kimnyeongensis TaxID=430679 RepID=A0ABW0TB63_9HYPH|nr:tripartite tricarboxylate transporter permease [Nitratireductor kimnyeongensis]QZZ36778.1 tripartite tricarboxylate transporter permease [Nitratireductor kimnyeongensis]
MDILTNLAVAFSNEFSSPVSLALILVGVMVGFTFGATPGLTATMGVALFIPLTFPLPADMAISMMIALYCGSMAGGAIPAILINIPGTPSAVVTTIDGYPMTRNGRAAEAYGWALVASVVGGIVAWVALVSLAPALARLALKLGSAEYAAVAFLGLAIISSVVSAPLVKGVLATVIGLGLSVVGFDQITGEGRWTFDSLQLTRGIGIMPALIGLLVIPELMATLFQRDAQVVAPRSLKGMFPTIKAFMGQSINMLRSSIIGVATGIIPALGGSVGALIAYDQARRFSGNQAEYGKGAPGGVVASESANNGVTGGALIPLLTLGIPGDTVTAMLLGGLMIHGLQPGPRLFETSGDIVWNILAAVLLANMAIIVVGAIGFRFFVKVLDVPKHLLAPALFVLAVVGTYSLSNSWFDVVIMLGLGVFGFFATLATIPVYPMVIGVILGPLLESETRRALVISGGDWTTFLTRPVSAVLVCLAIAVLVLPSLMKLRQMRADRSASATDIN